MYMDYRQSPKFQEILRQRGSVIMDLGKNQVGYLMRPKILPYLSIMMIPRVDDPLVLPSADMWSRKYHSIFVNALPRVSVNSKSAELWEKELKERGFSLAKSGMAPTKTLVVDLRLPETDILGRMKAKTRYNIRLAQRRNVKVKLVSGKEILANSKYLDEFDDVYKQNCRRIKMRAQPRNELDLLVKTFQDDVFITYAYINSGEIISVAFYIVCGDTVLYQMNGSTEKGRQNFAPCLAVWEGILEGKKRGCKWFDFDGIFDERFEKAQRSWKGFSRFKAGFGGQEVTYLGSFIKWLPFLKK